jgi:DNA-binding transcriptional ArsR family regulator
MSSDDHRAEATDQDLEQLTALFRLLSDKTRLSILLILADGERNVSSLCDHLQLPQPTVSHHLGLLRINNVIGNRRSGKQVFYTLNGRVNLGQDRDLEIGAERFAVRIARRTGLDSATMRIFMQ